MYASPEVLSTSARGRASDLFSMGCVWLEMFTVLLGERLEDFKQHRVPLSESSSDDFDDFETLTDGDFGCFAASLSQVFSWIESLIMRCNLHKSLILGAAEKLPGLDISCNAMIESLYTVEHMLQKDPEARPDAAALCQKLGSNPCCEQDVAPLEIAEGLPNIDMDINMSMSACKALLAIFTPPSVL